MSATTRERRCDRCDLPESMCTCAAQREQDVATRRDRAEIRRGSGVAVAQHPGICAECGDHFPAGTTIRVVIATTRQGDDPAEPAQWGHADPTECST